MKRVKRQMNRGFSLIEMIVVMAILSLVMTAVMSLIIPVQRSASVQSSLTDVQGNLRIAIERVVKDLRNAGFMFQTDPDATPPVTAVSGYANNVNVHEETVVVDASATPVVINTRAISGRFGRVAQFKAPAGTIELVYDKQSLYFQPGDYVYVAEPINGDPMGDGFYSVLTSGAGEIRIARADNTPGVANGTQLADNNDFDGSASGLVVYLAPTIVADDLDRTITYSHQDTDGDGIADALTRQIDAGEAHAGAVQYLARNVVTVEFTIVEDADGDVTKVTVALEGESNAAGGTDVVGQAIDKTVQSVVSLRNF